MSKKKKKISTKRKKFFIIISCYIANFLITSIFTSVTLAWFNGSTWQSNVLYMGGPVYIYFSDDDEKQTSGAGKLVTETPKNWDYLYPGMNIHFEAQAVVQGAKWEKPRYDGETQIVYTTGAVLRAKIRLEVIDTEGNNDSLLAQEIYNWIWPQLYNKATDDMTNEGCWIMDELDKTKQENNFFYYVNKNQSVETEKQILTEVGGVDYNVAVGFLNNAIITLPGLELTNIHADCDIKFTISFQAIQAFFPYTSDDIDTKFEGDLTGRDTDLVTWDDLGLGKPLSIKNSRRMFQEALDYRDDKLNINK